MIILSLSETVIHILLISISFLCLAIGSFIFILIGWVIGEFIRKVHGSILKWFKNSE